MIAKQTTIAILRPLPENVVAGLRSMGQLVGDHLTAPATPQEAEELLREAEIAFVTAFDSLQRPQLDAATRLRHVVSIGAGLNHIDLAEIERRGIRLRNAASGATEGTADLAFALLLAAARNIPAYDAFVRSGAWAAGQKPMMGRDLFGATLGIIGYGRIGKALAQRAAGFGMKVIFTARSQREPEPFVRQAPLSTLLREADFIIVQPPLTDETRGMIGADELAQMKPTAILINTSRGPVVQAEALAQALHDKLIAGAALDVYDDEPNVADVLLQAPNLLLTPHVGGATPGTHQRLFAEGLDIVAEALGIPGNDMI